MAGFLMPKEWWEIFDKSVLVIPLELLSSFFENLILVQDERWRRALSMQVKGGCTIRCVQPADG